MTGEILFLALVVGTFAAFSVVLAYESMAYARSKPAAVTNQAAPAGHAAHA